VPDILAPQGEFSVKLGLKRGGKISGEMDFENVTTRPLATLGPMRNVHATALLENDEITLTNAAANIGGQPIRLHGDVQLGENFWRNKSLPPFQLYVSGTNVPLVRQANVLVRADLNVAITNYVATNAIVAGTVKLRDSFFLSNLKDLAPGKVAAPERRPPYFSIEAEPFANWRLALQVTGEKFLKVQSPLFRGVVSTTMQLEGTLKEPLALGEARINSGNVTFPFGSLAVQQGFVSLTSANPYHPQLFVNATAQRLGYDIKMEATGPADQPIVQFSSSPPLSSEDIVLMLTTGRSPQGIANAGTRQRAQGIAVFVGKNLLSEFGIGGGGEDRLTVRSGEQVTEAGKPTYEVEYKLTDEWSLVGEYDRFGDYNAGLKWRIYSK
jgi:translocation and assembly module TamB